MSSGGSFGSAPGTLRIVGFPRPWGPEGLAAGGPPVPGRERGSVGERGGGAGDHLAVKVVETMVFRGMCVDYRYDYIRIYVYNT